VVPSKKRTSAATLVDVSEVGVPFDNVDEEALKRPVRWDI
jgi:hypothetical protein